MDWSSDGRYLAVTGGDSWNSGETWVWDMRQPLPAPCKKIGHPYFVVDVASSPDARKMAIIDDFVRGTINLWNIGSDHVTTMSTGHSNHLTCLCFTADSERLITGSGGGTIGFWDVATMEQVGTRQVGDNVRKVVFYPTEDAIVTASCDGIVRMWRA